MNGEISSPSLLTIVPRLTGEDQVPSLPRIEYQISFPPYPPGRLLEKNRILPSALIEGVDSHDDELTGFPRFEGTVQLPFLNAEK